MGSTTEHTFCCDYSLLVNFLKISNDLAKRAGRGLSVQLKDRVDHVFHTTHQSNNMKAAQNMQLLHFINCSDYIYGSVAIISHFLVAIRINIIHAKNDISDR